MSISRTNAVYALTLLLAVAFLALSTTISADAEEKKKMSDIQTTDSGLQYVIVEEGSGDPAVPGKTVKVHYTGKLEDGTEFDSSYKRGQPIEFTLGRGQVIKGWDEGIEGMAVGGRRELVNQRKNPATALAAQGRDPQDGVLSEDAKPALELVR